MTAMFKEMQGMLNTWQILNFQAKGLSSGPVVRTLHFHCREMLFIIKIISLVREVMLHGLGGKKF